jgi:hypothetical protein
LRIFLRRGRKGGSLIIIKGRGVGGIYCCQLVILTSCKWLI